jgi:hypothetical protein
MWWLDRIAENKRHLLGQLKEELDKLPRSYFLDRGKHSVNPGVNGEVGKGYYSSKAQNLPKQVNDIIEQIAAPTSAEMCLEMVVVNWYTPGGYIPPHVDREAFLAFGIMPLEDNTGVFEYYENNDLNMKTTIKDVAGQIIYTDNIMHLHSCKAFTNRYTLVTLYM